METSEKSKTGRKLKKFEEPIPRYAMTNKTNIMMWTYAHAYQSIYSDRNAKKAITAFIDDFNISCDFDTTTASVIVGRVNTMFHQTSTYEPFDLGNFYLTHCIDTMIYAWITFYQKHVSAQYDTEMALHEFDDYFEMDMTIDEFDIYLRRFNDMSILRCDITPTCPK